MGVGRRFCGDFEAEEARGGLRFLDRFDPIPLEYPGWTNGALAS